jgi:hypothetical protein
MPLPRNRFICLSSFAKRSTSSGSPVGVLRTRNPIARSCQGRGRAPAPAACKVEPVVGTSPRDGRTAKFCTMSGVPTRKGD